MSLPLLITLAAILFFEQPVRSQSSASDDTTSLSVNKNNAAINKPSAKITWTWQLPAPVKNAFIKSGYADWYVEKITKQDSNGKTFYRFMLDNGNLLDADHHDSFLRKECVEISGNGIILHKKSLY